MGELVQLFPMKKSIRPSPDEMISAAAQEHMAIRLREFAEAAIEHLHKFKRPLNGPMNARLMEAVEAAEGPR